MTTVGIAVTVIGLVLLGPAMWPSFRDRNRTPASSGPTAEGARHASDRYAKGAGGIGGGSV